MAPIIAGSPSTDTGFRRTYAETIEVVRLRYLGAKGAAPASVIISPTQHICAIFDLYYWARNPTHTSPHYAWLANGEPSLGDYEHGAPATSHETQLLERKRRALSEWAVFQTTLVSGIEPADDAFTAVAAE